MPPFRGRESYLLSMKEQPPCDAKSKSTLFNFVDVVATYTELRYFEAERAIGIVSIKYHRMR
jgi:hypothetical protein